MKCYDRNQKASITVMTSLTNKTGNVTYNITLRRVRITIVAVEKQ